MKNTATALVLLLTYTLCTPCLADVQVSAQERYRETNNAFAREIRLIKWDLHDLRVLLIRSEFDELEDIFLTLAKNYQSDTTYEYAWLFTYIALEDVGGRKGGEEAYGEFFDRWVEEKQSAVAYTARGFFYFGLASAHRGTGFISTTTRMQLDRMDFYIDKMRADFAIALKKDPGIIPIYEHSMHAAMWQGRDSLVKQNRDEALAIAPRSFWIRAKYLQHLQPRWGGSYEKMSSYIDSLENLYALNPRLSRLQGVPHADLANKYGRDEDYAAAVDSINKALNYGDKFSWLKARAYYNYQLQRYDDVIRDLERIASYGVGESNVRKLIEHLEIEKTQPGESVRKLRWGDFNFDT